jgi:ribosomal protein L44E
MDQKYCRECKLLKSLDQFYKHKMMADGHLNKCKDCVKLRVKAHREKNIDAIRAYDRERAKEPKRRANAAEVGKRWIKNNPNKPREYRLKHVEKYRARSAVSNAIRDGRLIREPCGICGSNKRVHGHHEDYSKPLMVKWRCPKCHAKEHEEDFMRRRK